MRNPLVFLVALLIPATFSSTAQRSFESWSFEQQDDPAYQLYKTAYNLVLQSNWKDAQKKFEEVLRQYPNSSYRDDASYWYAYCLKYQNQRKAVEALKKYLKEYPRSSYRSDALEDLAELQTRIQRNIVVTTDSIIRGTVHVAIPDVHVEIPDIAVAPLPALDADFPIGDRNAIWVFSNEMQDDMEWGYGYWPRAGRTRNLDENTRLKISALRGIAADRDSESFQTVRDILLDRNENPQLREEALRNFSRYERFDLLPTLKEIAKSDPDRHLREGAIYYIGKSERNKDAAAGALIELYTATPKDSTRLKERFLYSIARTGTNRGSDFLVSVAKSDEDYGLRESALYWLGRYGEGKQKKALYEILKGK
jgi:hypothetical protein